MITQDIILPRAYTVREIDNLRRVVEDRLTFGTCVFEHRSYQGSGPSREHLEEVVRTHMIAGHTAEDLIKEDTPISK